MKKELYIFSGLGADERVFQLLDFSEFNAIYIKWIAPHNLETIEEYSSRIINQITTKKPILIGLSFGGLIAIEVAKQIETEKVIILASAKTRQEIPFYYRIAGKLNLHKFIPTRLFKSSTMLTNWFFGTRSNKEKQILKQILIDTDPVFLKWAIDKIVNWNNKKTLKNIVHIHGTNDKILPLRFVNCHVKVKGGGHFMTLNKADELNGLLKKYI